MAGLNDLRRGMERGKNAGVTEGIGRKDSDGGGELTRKVIEK